MLNVTDAARAHLAKLVDSSAPENKAVRVIQSDDGFGVRFDDPATEDTVVEHDGKAVLVMDQQVGEQLTNRTLDAVDQQGGVALTLK